VSATDTYHPTIAEHVPDHDRLRVLQQGLIGSYRRKYDDEPRFRFFVDYLAELMLRLSAELAHQQVARIADASTSSSAPRPATGPSMAEPGRRRHTAATLGCRDLPRARR
jgi:hypothetical protein